MWAYGGFQKFDLLTFLDPPDIQLCKVVVALDDVLQTVPIGQILDVEKREVKSGKITPHLFDWHRVIASKHVLLVDRLDQGSLPRALITQEQHC